MSDAQISIHGHTAGQLPVEIPPGHIGPVVLPGTGRQIWWTGRVAIGLRHVPQPQRDQAVASSALWIQNLMLSEYPVNGTAD